MLKEEWNTAFNSDREHFEDYREQTQVKHEILAAYLPAYYHILKQWDKNLLFIDGFAGRGTYTKKETGETIDGSPLRALKLIAENDDFTKQVGTIFIESDTILFRQLDQTVSDFYAKHPQIRKPICLDGAFADRVKEILDGVRGNLAPTFLFVDPCGVSGTCFEKIRAVMNCNKCEAFIFFNIDGVRRIAGLDALSDVLVELMGSKDRAKALYEALRKTDDVAQRERLIISHYRRALRDDIGAGYTIPFRVEHEDKQKTSHYLIHATKHPLGFKIMKAVMWRRGHSDDQAGGLELSQKSRTNFIPLFDNRGDTIKQAITEGLANGPQKVDLFCSEWVMRPDDEFAEPAYKQALLELEEHGSIEVLGKDGKTPTPANARQKRKGKSTLGSDYYIRLPKNKKN